PLRTDVARHRRQNDLPRLAGVARLHGDDNVERHAGGRSHRNLRDGGELALEGAEERRLERHLLEDVVLGDRLAGEQPLEDRLATMGDRGDAADRLLRGPRVIPVYSPSGPSSTVWFRSTSNSITTSAAAGTSRSQLTQRASSTG